MVLCIKHMPHAVSLFSPNSLAEGLVVPVVAIQRRDVCESSITVLPACDSRVLR